jgi:hypothetical protein
MRSGVKNDRLSVLLSPAPSVTRKLGISNFTTATWKTPTPHAPRPLVGGGGGGRYYGYSADDKPKRESSHDLLRFQNVLANSSPYKRAGSDQRECGSLGSAGQVEIRGLVSRSNGLRTSHCSVHTDRWRANNAA